ncbi:hypothetical protein KAR91_48765 [Candidatus Pacearchaeota archaeon]|nr:hypothetical protein [Candidatus Pacearchaeota archaeon]
MSLDFDTIKTTLATWALLNTGCTKVIWADQDAPQPYNDDQLKKKYAYITLRYALTEQIGEDHTAQPVDVGGVSIISGNREFTLFIQVKGKNAIAIMNQLLDSFQKYTVQQTLWAGKVAYVDNFPIQNITGLDDTRFIERASMDVRLRTWSEIEDTVGIIETVEVTGDIKDVLGNTVYDDTVTITLP